MKYANLKGTRVINLRLFILVGSIFFLTCSEVENVVQQEEINQEEANQHVLVPPTDFIDKITHWKTRYSINPELYKGMPDYEDNKILIDIPELWLPNSKSDWKEIDQLLSVKIEEIIGDGQGIVSMKERLASASIQLVSLKFIRTHLLNEEPSIELGMTMEKYLMLLMRHKSIDIHTMADGLNNHKDYIDLSRYRLVRDYLLNISHNKIKKAHENIEKHINNLNNTEGKGGRTKWNFNAKEVESNTKEANYVIDLLKE